MGKSRGLYRLGAAALLLLLLTANGNAFNQYVIGAMVWDLSVPFYAKFIKGLNDGAVKYNLNLLIRDGRNNPTTQNAVIRRFIAEKVNLILVAPGYAQPIVPALQHANEAGIPVLAVNNKIDEGVAVVTFVGADDSYFGKQQAKLLIQAIGKSGKVGYLMGALGTSAQSMRKKGFDNYLKDYPLIKIVACQTEDWDSAKALIITQELLSQYKKGELQAIVCQGPEGLLGAQFAANSGRAEVKFILGDYPASVKKAIQNGIVYGTVNQDPYPQAVEGMHMALLYLTGNKSEIPSPHYYLELPLVTRRNVFYFAPAWND